jgi:hypothetical protein
MSTLIWHGQITQGDIVKLENIHPDAWIKPTNEQALRGISPKLATPFKDGTVRKVGEWRYEDFSDLVDVRQVFHYDTLMGQFEDSPQFGWTFEPISTGWGSASDQQGMNKIMGNEWHYYRNGGDPRYVAYDGVTVFRGFPVDC